MGSNDEPEGSGSESEGSEVIENKELSAAQLLLLRVKRLQTRKAKIAKLSSQILEDPQTNVCTVLSYCAFFQIVFVIQFWFPQ